MEKKLFKFNEEYQSLRNIINNLTDEEIDNYFKLILTIYHITALDLLLEEFSIHLLKENNLPIIDVVNFARGILLRELRYKEFFQKYRKIVYDNHVLYLNRTERGVYLKSEVERLIKEKKVAKVIRVNARQRFYRNHIKPKVEKIKVEKIKVIKVKVLNQK